MPQGFKTARGVAFSRPRPSQQHEGLHFPAPGLESSRRDNSRRPYPLQPQGFYKVWGYRGSGVLRLWALVFGVCGFRGCGVWEV